MEDGQLLERFGEDTYGLYDRWGNRYLVFTVAEYRWVIFKLVRENFLHSR